MNNNNIFIGLDVASNSFALGIIDSSGEKLAPSKIFPNSPKGTQKSLDIIMPIVNQVKPSSIFVASESTSCYDFHIANFFADTLAFNNINVSVFRLDPFRINKFRKAIQQINKTDLDDPFLIAEFIRLGKNLPAPHNPFEPFLGLRKLVRFRLHIVNNLVSETNFLISQLFLKVSSYVQDKPIKFTSATSLDFIEDILSDEDVVYSSIDEILRLVIKSSKNRFENPQEVTKTLHSCIRESFRIKKNLSVSLNIVLTHTIRNIRALKQNIKQIDKAIKDELKAFPNTLDSVGGIGPIFTSGIISEIGYISKYQNNDKIAKLAGLVWPRIQSGNFEAEERRMLRRSNKYLRYYLVEAANSVRRNDIVFSKYYWKKYNEVTKHQHKRALVLTARKLVRVIFYLLKTENIYQPQMLDDTHEQKKVS